MAGTDTAPRRWMLPSALLIVLLASFGRDNFIATVQGDAGRGKYWRCPTCNRVEWREDGGHPWCEGTPRRQHDPVETDPETGPNVRTTDGDYWFFLAD
jgi:hypothetical protein